MERKMTTKEDYTLNYTVANSSYGEITIPKGTKVTNKTALGIDKNYHFVDEFEWIDEKYPTISRILKHDMQHYGINIPKDFVDFN